MADILFSPGVKVTETDRSYVPARPLVAGAAIIGPTVKGPAYSPTIVTSYAGYQQAFGSTFMMSRYSADATFDSSSGALISGSKIAEKSQEFLTSMAAKSFFEQGGDSLLVVRVTDGEFKSGKAVVPAVSSSLPAFTINTVAQGNYLNNWSGSFQNRAEDPSAIAGVIRADGSLISGSKDNIRFEITDVDPETGTFTLLVRRGDDLDADKLILESFANLSLDPDSENYIARKIGDQHQVLRHDLDDDLYYIDVVGNYPSVSNYIYVSDVNPIYGYFLADGYTVKEGAANFLPQSVEGGFSNADGKLFATEEAEAKAVFFGDINAENVGKPVQGLRANKLDDIYGPAIRILSNTDEYDINIISAPGINLQNASDQVKLLDSLATERGDLIAVIDLVGFSSDIPAVTAKATDVNSSYSATYWPWLQMYSSTGRLEWVPASVVIPGVYTFTDHIAAPWFAPAGMTRGSLQGVIQAERKLLRQHRDKLYKKNVNPIGILPGNGLTVYGQKTLQKKATALDRVNVRRLMIELKRTVKVMASGLLFEQNTAALRNQFKGNLDNYLESVVQRMGLYGYETIVSELNTPDVIDRNEFRCQIYVQPTKVTEFIYIDFTITNTGVEFRS